MKKENNINKILKEKGLVITGWEETNVGFGISFQRPVIVDKETGEPFLREGLTNTPKAEDESLAIAVS
jgi:hypothetical protein